MFDLSLKWPKEYKWPFNIARLVAGVFKLVSNKIACRNNKFYLGKLTENDDIMNKQKLFIIFPIICNKNRIIHNKL